MGYTATVPPRPTQQQRHPVIQGLIDFLQSPFWINPIQSFIDENCLVFGGEEENCLEHTSVHEKFRELIENLLEFLVGEMNLSHEVFIKALQSETNDETLGQALEHIMAMDDFLSFKKIMERRNLQLECETIEEMKKKKSEPKTTTVTIAPNSVNDEEELQKVMELSKQEHEQSKNREKSVSEREEYELAFGFSLSEQERYLEERQRRLEQAELEMAIAISLSLQEEQQRRELEEEAERLRLQELAEKRRQEELKLEEERRLEEERQQKLLQQVMEEEERRKLKEQLEKERREREQREEQERIKREEELERIEKIKREEERIKREEENKRRMEEQRQMEETKKRLEREQQEMKLVESKKVVPVVDFNSESFNFKTTTKSDQEIKEELDRIQKEKELLQKLMADKEKQQEEAVAKILLANNTATTPESITIKKEIKEGKEKLVEKKKQERELRLKEFKLKLTDLKKVTSTDNSPKSATSVASSPSAYSQMAIDSSRSGHPTPKNAKSVHSPLSTPSSTTPKSSTSSDDDTDAKKRMMIREALSKRVKEDLLRQTQPPLQFSQVPHNSAAEVDVQNNDDHLRSLLNNVVRNLKKNVDEEDFHFSETK